MSLPLPILLPLTSGSGKGRMDLECERVAGRPNRYRVFAREGDQRWEVLPAGAPLEAEARGWTRDQAISAALLAGFSKRQVERAIRKASA